MWSKRLRSLTAAALLAAAGCVTLPPGTPPEGTIVKPPEALPEVYSSEQAVEFMSTMLQSHWLTAPAAALRADADEASAPLFSRFRQSFQESSGIRIGDSAGCLLESRLLPDTAEKLPDGCRRWNLRLLDESGRVLWMRSMLVSDLQ